MFKKIVSTLPFSPALVGQLGFYAKRLRNEETTRRLGLFFVALALIVQSLAVFQPSQSANAASDADMIYGGIKSLNEILAAYDNNTRNFRFNMNRVGVTREELASTSYGKFTVGDRLTWALTTLYSYEQGEREFAVYDDSSQVVSKLYSRPLKTGVGCTDCTKTGWIGVSEKLGWFAIREMCGNLITDTNPPAPKLCQYNQSLLATDPECKPCEYNAFLWYKSILCMKPIVVEPLKCIYNSSLLARDIDCRPCIYNLAIWHKNPLCKKPVVVVPDVPVIPENKCSINPSLLASDPKCISCPGNESVWADDPSCIPNIVKSKTATNVTQGNITASSITAKAGDQISYTITIENIGTKSATDIKLDDNLTDVVEYATLSDYGGGSYDTTTRTLSWPSIVLMPRERQTRTFSVKLPDSIPATAQGLSNETSFDCIATNTFGNSININIDCPAPKIIEQVATNLPVTGPKENILFAGIVLAITTYFYARARQQGKEIRLIRKDFSSGTL